MKKFIKLFYIFILVIGLFINIGVVNAKDVTEYFTVVDAHVCGDTNCDIEYTKVNGFSISNPFLVKFNWKYDGPAIEEGDIITIPFANEVDSKTTTYWNGMNTTNSPIYDNNGNKIATFTIFGSQSSKKLRITFSESAYNKSYLEGTIITSQNGSTYECREDTIVPITIGNKVVNFMIYGRSLPEGSSSPNRCTLGSTGSNSNAEVAISTYPTLKMVNQLYRYDEYDELTDDAIINNLYFEIVSDGTFDYHSFNIPIYEPTDIENHYCTLKAINSIDNNATRGLIKKVEPLDTETYKQFKNRLQELEWGIYEDNEKNYLVVNFGDFPKNYKYSEFLDESLGEFASKFHQFYFKDEWKPIIDNALGDNNIIEGKVASLFLKFILTFPQVYEDSEKTISQTISYTNGLGEQKIYSRECLTTLKVPNAISVSKGQATLILKDLKTKNPINGVKLQLKKKDGNNWINVGEEQTTDEGGMVSLKQLEDGVYKWVQNTFKTEEHYKTNSYVMYLDTNLENVIEEFILDGNGNLSYASNDREDIIITFKKGSHGNFNDVVRNLKYGDGVITPEVETTDGWTFIGWDKEVNLTAVKNEVYTALWEKKVNITEHYYVTGTTTKVKNDIKTIKNVGDIYSVIRNDSGIANKYNYKNTVGTLSGTVPDGNVEIIYYYELKPATVTTKHLEETTNIKLADDVIQNKKFDDAYTTTKASSIGANYDMVRTTGDPVSGTITKDSYVVTYYYKKKNSKITNNISKTSTNTDITNKEDIVNYTITNNVNITDYIGNGTITITDTLPYEIDVDKSNINGGTYNNDNKTLTWTETWNGIDSFNNKGNKTITKNISVVFVGIDSKQRVINNNISSKVLLDNNESINSDNLSVPLQIKGKVIIKYLDEDDNELTNTIEEENLVGETISSEVLDFEGYDLIEKPESEVHEIKDEITEIIYRYKKKVLNIEVEGAIGGKVTGSGSVKYGEDSNDLIINADEGYCIDKIIVDDKEINVVNCKNQTIDKLTNVKENHKVKVTFKKNVITTNPLTGSLLKIACLIILIGISAILIINNKKFIKNN